MSEELLSLPAHSPSTAGTTEPQGCHWPTAGPATVETENSAKKTAAELSSMHMHSAELRFIEDIWFWDAWS